MLVETLRVSSSRSSSSSSSSRNSSSGSSSSSSRNSPFTNISSSLVSSFADAGQMAEQLPQADAGHDGTSTDHWAGQGLAENSDPPLRSAYQRQLRLGWPVQRPRCHGYSRHGRGLHDLDLSVPVTRLWAVGPLPSLTNAKSYRHCWYRIW